MAHSLSARKRIRQNVKRQRLNRWRKRRLKQAIKDLGVAVATGDTTQASEQLKLCYKRLDQVAAAGTIHKNTAARRKAKLARAVAALT